MVRGGGGEAVAVCECSVCGGVLLAHLKDAVPEGGLQVRVGDLLDTHVVHQAQVLPLLLPLELVYRDLTVVNCQPMDQFLVVGNVLICNFNGSLKIEDVIFLALARLENALKRGLALRKFLELLLIIALLGLRGRLHLDHGLSAYECVTHSLEIKELSLDHNVGLLIRIPEASEGRVYALLQIIVHIRVREDSLARLAVTVELYIIIFVFEQ